MIYRREREDFEYATVLLDAYLSFDLMDKAKDSYILGFPHFTQDDIRYDNKDLQDHIMLFQLDTQITSSLFFGVIVVRHTSLYTSKTLII